MSISLPNYVVRAATRPITGWAMSPKSAAATQRSRMELIARISRPPRGVRIEATEIGGVPAELLTPRAEVPGRVLLYLHGGGFVVGSPKTHRGIAGRLASRLRASTYVLDYRLAPEHPFPAGVDDVIAAYRALLDAGFDAGSIFVAGDSAGGGLSLSLGVAAKQLGLPQPAALGLICGGFDITQGAMAAIPRRSSDTMLTKQLIDYFRDAYISPEQATDPLASPLRTDLSGLAPMVIEAAQRDLLVDQSRRLSRLATAAGVSVSYIEHRDQTHVFHATTGLLRYADTALDTLADRMLEFAAGSALEDAG